MNLNLEDLATGAFSPIKRPKKITRQIGNENIFQSASSRYENNIAKLKNTNKTSTGFFKNNDIKTARVTTEPQLLANFYKQHIDKFWTNNNRTAESRNGKIYLLKIRY